MLWSGFILRNYFKKILGGSSTIWALVLLIAACFSVWSIYFHRPDGLLHIRQGLSADTSFVFIESPAGNTYLLDLEGDPNETSAALTPLLSPWNYHLDGIILTRSPSEIALGDLNASLPVKSILAANSILRPAAGDYPLSLPDTTSLLNLSSTSTLEIEQGVYYIGHRGISRESCLRHKIRSGEHRHPRRSGLCADP